MYHIKVIDKISADGLSLFDRGSYEILTEFDRAESLIVRSSKIKPDDISTSVQCIGRAGIGVNNIPVDYCSQKGIVVFNTPGANANGVKELVLLGMLLAARDVFGGITYVRSLNSTSDAEINQLVEVNKSKYKGYEIKGKHIGIIGLGAIGIMVANDCIGLGLDVSGYDPYISVERAWALSRDVQPASSLDKILSGSDFISVHVPLTDQTKGLINRDQLAKCKKGAVILNFARGEIVSDDDMLDALQSGHISAYVTDFPSAVLMGHPKVLSIPHLGASTRESEDNCAFMVVQQIKDFLENGHIKNSVNFPECSLDYHSDNRLIIANNNIPNMLGQITTVLAQEGINISNMVNKSKGDLAYNIVDIVGGFSSTVVDKIRCINGVIMARAIVR